MSTLQREGLGGCNSGCQGCLCQPFAMHCLISEVSARLFERRSVDRGSQCDPPFNLSVRPGYP
eukprot:3612129-Amphidinium_carterae.1